MSHLLKRARLARSLTQAEVAAAIGVTQPYYSNLENGEKGCTPDTAQKLAKFFGNVVTRDQILFPQDYADPNPEEAA